MTAPSPSGGEGATWKGLLIIAGAALVGFGVSRSFPDSKAVASGVASESPASDGGDRQATTTTVAVPATTSTTLPLRNPREVKVLVANATTTVGATRKVVDALKPACYAVQQAVEATTKVKAEKRPTSTVYSTPGFEREAALITTQLRLLTTANAPLPAESPVARAAPGFDVLVLVAADLAGQPPEPLPACPGAPASTSTTRRGATTTSAREATTSTTRRAASTTSTTRRASTTSTTRAGASTTSTSAA